MKELHKKLTPVPITEHLEMLQRKRFQGTCSWIMNKSDFNDLLTSERRRSSGVTWVCGLPGCGKTYLSAYIIEKLELIGPTGYFFCDTKSKAKKDVFNILRTWAWQLCEKLGTVIGEVVRMLRPAVEITWKLIHSVFTMLFQRERCCYLVIDGLDECEIEDRANILDFIGELADRANVVIISRKEADIEHKLRNLERRVFVKRIYLSAKDNKADIERYVQEEAIRLEISDPILLTRIIVEVGNRAQGMFLYARLMLNELHRTDTDEERYYALQHLPEGIDAVYSRSMTRIEATKQPRRDRILRLLQWVVHASRPLTVDELEIALAITPNEDVFKSGNKPNVGRLFLDYCTSLLELDQETNTLQCIHATAKDFLTQSSQSPLVDTEDAHAYAASICLTYLNYSERDFVKRFQDTRTIPFSEPWPWFRLLHPPFYLHLEDNRFLQYSASHWIFHLAQTTSTLKLTENVKGYLRALKVLFSSEVRMLRWIEIFHFLYVVDLDGARLASETLDQWIHEYEYRELSPQVRDSIDRKRIELELTGAYSNSAFSFNGFPQVDINDHTSEQITNHYLSDHQLSFLGSSWPDTMAHLGHSTIRGIHRWRRLVKTELMPRKPLHLAAYFNYCGFLQDEFKRGAYPEEQDAMDHTILDQAAWGESNQAIKVLVDHGADKDHCPNFTFFDGLRPLLLAVFSDQFKPSRDREYSTARFLLDIGAKVESNVCPLNPLHTMFDWWMESESELAILNTILDHTESVDHVLDTPSPYNGMNSLHIATRNDLPKTMEIFLSRHSDKKSYATTKWGADSKTALHEACYHRKSSCGPLLLAAGAEVNCECTVSFSTPLHIAALSRSDMLSKLLEAGADSRKKDASGRTCLHFAAMQDWEEGIRLILDYNGDFNAVDHRGQTALEAAVENGCQISRQILLDAGAKPIAYRKAPNLYWPRVSSDVFEVYFLLKLCCRNKAPYELLSRIINSAQYWLKSSSEASYPMLVQQADCGRPYLASKPITGHSQHPVRRITVKVESKGHEGAYTALFPEPRSWTWHELAKSEKGRANTSADAMVSGPKLAENAIDVAGTQVHIHMLPSLTSSKYCSVMLLSWRSADFFFDKIHERTIFADSDADSDIALWVHQLRRSEAVCIVPMARWPERVNKVLGARMDIFTTCLRPALSQHHEDDVGSLRRLRLNTDALGNDR